MRGEEETLPEFHHSNRGSRRTRSQVAPELTETDSLILVNVITAVEADCQKKLSSFQKWKIVAQNCTALGVGRTLDQYRRKWEALLHHYKIINNWNDDSQSKSANYWALDAEKRKQFGLPKSFDRDLFKCIGEYEKLQENENENESDTAADEDDDEDEDEEEDEDEDDDVAVVEPEPKKRKRRLTQQKSSSVQNPARSCGVKNPVQKHRQIHAEEKPVQKPCQSMREAKTAVKHVEKPLQTCAKDEPAKKPQQTYVEGKKPLEKSPETHTKGKPVEKPPQTHEEDALGMTCQIHVEGKPIEKPYQTHAEERLVENLAEEMPHHSHAEEKPAENCLEAIPPEKLAEMPQKSSMKKKNKASKEKTVRNCIDETISLKSLAEKRPQKSGMKRKRQNSQTDEKAASIDKQEQIMAMKLQWSAEMIRAIVTETADHEATDEKSTKDLQADLVRHKGDQVIACLGEIVKMLSQVHHLVQERK